MNKRLGLLLCLLSSAIVCATIVAIVNFVGGGYEGWIIGLCI